MYIPDCYGKGRYSIPGPAEESGRLRMRSDPYAAVNRAPPILQYAHDR